MLFKCSRENENVIHIDDNTTFSDKLSENVVHHRLESGWTIGQTEKHHQGFEQSLIGNESGLPFIAFLNPHVVVTPSNIQLCEVFSPFEFVDQFGDEW